MSTPDRIHALASGRRFCACNDVKLIVTEWELQNPIPYSSDNMKNLMMEVIQGIRYGKPTKGWQACCSQCDKIYLAVTGIRGRNELLRQIQQSGMEAT
jgi:hypothetical protein